MDRGAILKRLEELNAMPEVRNGFPNQEACLTWVNEVTGLLSFRSLYHDIAVQQAQLLSRRSLSATLLAEAMRTLRSQVEQAIIELKSDPSDQNRTPLIPTPPIDPPTSIGVGRVERIGRRFLAHCPPWVPAHCRLRFDRFITRRQWHRLNQIMEKEEFRNNEHLEANEELHDRYYYITDQLHEHDDEHMLQLNIRRGIEVPVHGSREDGPNEHWNVSRFTGQWLLTHNGRAHVTKAFREHWLAGRKRWQVILAIIGTLLGIIGVLWPGFREYLFSFFKN